MPELLLELFSEEIPARMQMRAKDDLARLLAEALRKAGLSFGTIRSFATPRRLTVVVDGLPAQSPDISEEKKGPRVDAPDSAVGGFLKSAGLVSVAEAERREDKKGAYYVAKLNKPGRATSEVVAEIVPDIVRAFPWPKSMRWGSGRLRWVRPLHAILCIFDGEVVPFEIDGIASGAETRGHRFMAPEPFTVESFDDYAAKLRQAYVILDGQEREDIILSGARALAAEQGLALVEDAGLTAENAGLAEWPVPLLGSFDESFLEVPPEVLTTSMKTHQKCFSLRNLAASESGGRAGKKRARDISCLDGLTLTRPGAPVESSPAGEGDLANRFIAVANLAASDGGEAIIAGNERVIRARMSDAKFFFDQDRKIPLEACVPKLKEVVFHEKLGSQYERVQRLWRLAREIAPLVGAEPDIAERAAILCKADLVCEMVGEFPELQGVMGRYYALDQKEDPLVADAIAAHYKPVGPSDAVPREPTAIAVALADKLDTLIGFWAIGEKPTGSKDPYALRRAALGVVRIVLENGVRLKLLDQIQFRLVMPGRRPGHPGAPGSERAARDRRVKPRDDEKARKELAASLLAFFADRLKVHLRDQGARHDLIDAVFALPDQDDLLMIVRRVAALGKFLDSEDGANLLTGTKRAINILRIEEKKDSASYAQPPDPKLFELKEEKALATAVNEAERAAASAIENEDFEMAMAAMAKLRAPVDQFFDHVTVNADDAKLRANRLRLLNRIRAATLQVADFSKIEG